MPTKGFLNQEQNKRLQKVLRSKDYPRWQEHPLLLLLQNNGNAYV